MASFDKREKASREYRANLFFRSNRSDFSHFELDILRTINSPRRLIRCLLLNVYIAENKRAREKRKVTEEKLLIYRKTAACLDFITVITDPPFTALFRTSSKRVNKTFTTISGSTCTHGRLARTKSRESYICTCVRACLAPRTNQIA